MTVSELYALLLHDPKARDQSKNPARDVTMLNRASTVFLAREAPGGAAPRRLPVSATVERAMERMAAAAGMSEGEAWAEAANHWLAQRRRDMEELASPAGQSLATAVQRVWSVIDDQMRDLRPHRERGE